MVIEVLLLLLLLLLLLRYCIQAGVVLGGARSERSERDARAGDGAAWASRVKVLD